MCRMSPLTNSARRRGRWIFFALSSGVMVASALALSSGAVDVPAADLIRLLHASDTVDPAHASVVLDLRLPRVLLGLLVGAALACAGTAMQGLFRNPLADPGLVGVASGAALAAVAAIVLVRELTQGLPILAVLGPWFTPLASFAGGLAAAALAARLASHDGYTRTATLLLAGLAINAIAGAGIGLLTQLAGDAALREAIFWLFGSLAKSGWKELAVGGPVLLLVLLWLPREARALNALLLGEAEAGHLGVDVERLKRRVTALIVLAVATAVALAGAIGFIGLVVPHLLRLLLGPDHRALLPASALGGALLLVLADLGARTWLAPAELPVGILTALVGGPFFLALLMRFRNRVEAW